MKMIASIHSLLNRSIKLIAFLSISLNIPSAFAQLETVWVKRYHPTEYQRDYATAMALDSAGNVYVTGVSHLSSGIDIATVKYYTIGDTAWVRSYSGAADSTDWAQDIAVDPLGNVYVTGYSYSDSTYEDYLTIKYSPAGDILWTRTYDGSDNICDGDVPWAVALDNAGNIYITGSCIDFDCNRNIVTIKYASNGDSVWIARYDGPEGNDDYASAMAVDDSGNVYITGVTSPDWTGPDFVTLKYYSDGEVAWARQYCNPESLYFGADYPEAIAVDHIGNVYVTGYTQRTYTDLDCTTIKYDVNGDTVWVRTFSGDGAHADRGVDIVADDLGFVYVFGQTYSENTYNDYLTIKYSSNGDTEWVRVFDGTGNYQDFGYGLGIDPYGNVFATGSSCVERYNWDYTTIMYYPDGALGWVESYDGNEGEDSAIEIALDPEGNIYVTGSSVGDNLDEDYATIKYRQTQVWLEENVVSEQRRPVHLSQNNPNPFNPSTTISYSIPEQSDVRIEIYNIIGQRVATLLDGNKQAGYHSIVWQADNHPSGVYFARLEAGGRAENVKMVLLK